MKTGLKYLTMEALIDRLETCQAALDIAIANKAAAEMQIEELQKQEKRLLSAMKRKRAAIKKS
jgi:hypothetical protein